ncbi:MAG TPA: copper chaperone PCu(A)C [Burkholderiales bacterium]
MQRVLLAAACLLLTASAAASGGPRIADAWARATPPGAATGAVYFVLTGGDTGDRLLGASSPVAERAELHATTMSDGMMRMRAFQDLPLAAGETVRFEPGGRHVMLIGLKQPLREGDTVPLTLTFERAGAIEVRVEVRSAGAGHGAAHGAGHGDGHGSGDHHGGH